MLHPSSCQLLLQRERLLGVLMYLVLCTLTWGCQLKKKSLYLHMKCLLILYLLPSLENIDWHFLAVLFLSGCIVRWSNLLTNVNFICNPCRTCISFSCKSLSKTATVHVASSYYCIVVVFNLIYNWKQVITFWCKVYHFKTEARMLETRHTLLLIGKIWVDWNSLAVSLWDYCEFCTGGENHWKQSGPVFNSASYSTVLVVTTQLEFVI